MMMAFLFRRMTLPVVLMVAVVSFAMGCRATPEEKIIAVSPRPLSEAWPVPTAVQAAGAQWASADELYTVYSRHLIIGATADQRFQNRLLRVVGVFNGVNHGLPGRPYLELRTHDPSAFVYAMLSPDAESLTSTLVPGTPVELLCRGNSAVGGSPLLRDCRGR